MERILPALIACVLIHEGGHFLTALCFGRTLKFRFAWGRLGKIPVPRCVWAMPEMDTWKQKAVALAGFGAEFLAIPAMFFLCPGLWMIYGAVAAAHIAAYKFYAGEESDFKWI